MKNKLLLTVLCFSVSSLLWAQKKEMETITESDLKYESKGNARTGHFDGTALRRLR